jgi:Fe-S cluster assembly scaffold protein SufB
MMATSAHFYLNWAKERIDEMDAVVSSLEDKTSQITAQSRTAAERLIADLRERRDAFLENMQKQAEAGESAWAEARAKMEADWNGFQTDMKKYVDDFGPQLKQQQTTFQAIAAAQLKAWREAAERIQVASTDLAAGHRAKLDAAVEQMRADASAAEANFQKLARAGGESWGALTTALSESRAAFDKANQAAWNAFKRAGSGA